MSFPQLDASALGAEYHALSDRFGSAKSEGQLLELVASIDKAVDTLDSDLRHYVVAHSKKHQQAITNVELHRAKLTHTILGSAELKQLFSSANDLGHLLTLKIRSLDHEIDNVNSTLSFVQDIQTLRNNINQANYAIDHNNPALAAQCINTIINTLDPALVRGKFASAVIPSTDIPELPHVKVDAWIEDLTQVFVEGFNAAAERKDVPGITQFFQLFPLINREEVGLTCYSKFICSIITDTSRRLINSAAPKPGIFASIAMQLFENVSMMLSQHGPLINKYYAQKYPTALTFVVSRVQREIDSQIGLVCDTFYDLLRIDKVLQDIKLYKFAQLEGAEDSADEDFVSIVEVSDLIDEFASILHHWALYCKFITVKYYPKEKPELPPIVGTSNFTKKIHAKYLPAFEHLYQFYFRRSLEKAISIEEKPNLDAYLIQSRTASLPDVVPVSSVVEDFTLVLNLTLRNVLDTSQPTTVRHFVSSCIPVIQKDFINGFLVKLLNDHQPRYNATLTLVAPVASGVVSPARSTTPVPKEVGFLKGASSALNNVVASTTASNAKLGGFVVYLNTAAMCHEYVAKIHDNIAKTIDAAFPFGDDAAKVHKTLKLELTDPILLVMSKIITESLVKFYNQLVKNKIITLINDMFPDTEEAYVVYSLSQLNDTSLVLSFTESWHALVAPYKQTFHRLLVYDKLIRLLVVNLANLLEKRLMAGLRKFKVNELGALKLEKDLLSIINHVCEDNYDLREKFVRLTQLVLLVEMDDDEYELSVHHTDDGINWVLTPQERKALRKLRI